MGNLLYPGIAAGNIRKNGKLYLPYLLTVICTVAMFYDIASLTYHPTTGDGSVREMMLLGTRVTAVFSVIFLFYTNSFILKRRKKEFGLFNILGMEKKHIALVMFFENIYIAAAGVVLGLGAGMLLSRAVTMLMNKLLHFDAHYSFTVGVRELAVTLALFAGIFLATFLNGIRTVVVSRPIELLSSASAGEREPKTKWILTAIGVASLGAGYTLAIVIKEPIQALLLFFLAVIFVMIGTYCLFTAGSIALLKALKKNKKYYYKTSHFCGVSGMLYRMKQNAVGLANICLLATAVLVMVSVTVSMFAGISEIMDTMYPRDFQIYLFESENIGDDRLEQLVRDSVDSCGYEIKDFRILRYYRGEADWNNYLFMNEKIKSTPEGEICGYLGQDFPPNVYIGFNMVTGSDTDEKLHTEIDKLLYSGEIGEYSEGFYETKTDKTQMYFGLFGSLLFLGGFLGILFLIATVMIIYYKQISEGYEDKDRFEIMKKVGMTAAEVRKTIRSQVLTVFFLPIAAAGVHICFAFPMLTRLLALVSLTNTRLFAVCTLITAAVFTLVYLAVYLLTAKAYYRIVGR